MSEAPKQPESSATLAVEFQRLARYLIGAVATPYQIEKYIAAHRSHVIAPKSNFEALLLKFARSGGLGLALADAYSGFFARTSVVRAKLVAALALLEVSPPSFIVLDRPSPRGKLAWVGSAIRGGFAAIALIIATVILLPLQILSGRSRSTGDRA